MTVLRVCVVALLCFGVSLAITQEEIDQFFDVEILDQQGQFVVVTDNVPSHDVGDFPNPDNPNTIRPQDFRFELYKNPTPADISCVPNGPIGVTKGGIALFNPYDINGRDAVIYEVFDDCHGHPDTFGVYHYHQDPTCLHAGEPGILIGAAFDGYPIYGYRDVDGSVITTGDLDLCGGRYVNGEYRYHITLTFPYTIGCFSGDVPQWIKDKQNEPSCRFAFPDKYQRHRAAEDLVDSGATSTSAASTVITFTIAAVTAWFAW